MDASLTGTNDQVLRAPSGDSGVIPATVEAQAAGLNGSAAAASDFDAPQITMTNIPLQQGVYPPSADVAKMLQCMQQECPGTVTGISSTSEPYKAHGPTNPHSRGLAADVKTADAPTAMQCAADCGAVFQLDEYLHPSAGSNGAHVHLQLVPGLDGATRPYSNFQSAKPIPRPDQ